MASTQRNDMAERAQILIVDDQPSALYTLELLLSSEPYDVTYATDGFEALAAVEAAPPDLILLDAMMPGMTGFEVSRQLKGDERWQHIPIILVTALDRKEALVRGLESGADEFVNKPVHGAELRARVKSMLRIKRMYDELQQTIETREEMAHMIIHDMRNPLASLMMFADLLGCIPDPTPQITQLHRRIRLQTHRLNDFLTDLLLLAKMQSGKLLLNRETVDLQNILETARKNQSVMAEARDIVLEVDGGDGGELPVDYKLFLRAIDNLVSNAIKFAPEGSTVTLRLRRQEGELHVQVLDQGPGVPPEHREIIFSKYEIAPVQRENVSQIGLGLAFCQKVVQAHGGGISVTDNEPTGAVFTIALPWERAARCLP